jgi:putative transcriptional regulator
MFSKLRTSLEEAVAIENRTRAASRESRYTVVDVKSIRSQFGASQQEFATALGITTDTLDSWESKQKHPTGLFAMMLVTIRDNPNYYKALVSS